MRVYVGQTRSRKLIARLAALGFGECVSRSELPPRRQPWFLDNGAFGDWRSQRPFDSEAYASDLRAVPEQESPPDFVVCPDVVAGGLASLRFSLGYMERLRAGLPARTPVYLVTQDGMEVMDVAAEMGAFQGLFVGGTLGWKLRTAATWVQLAHDHGQPCHIGRIGTERRVRWARRIGADSIDSCLPLWSEKNLQRFLAGIDGRQMELAL